MISQERRLGYIRGTYQMVWAFEQFSVIYFDQVMFWLGGSVLFYSVS